MSAGLLRRAGEGVAPHDLVRVILLIFGKAKSMGMCLSAHLCHIRLEL
jgi:hypothetical protein